MSNYEQWQVQNDGTNDVFFMVIYWLGSEAIKGTRVAPSIVIRQAWVSILLKIQRGMIMIGLSKSRCHVPQMDPSYVYSRLLSVAFDSSSSWNAFD